MLIVEVVVVVLVLFAIAAIVAGRGSAMWRPAPDAPDAGLPPERSLRADDVQGLSFRLGLRGYRMDEVDRALARLHEALGELETENAQLRATAEGTEARG